jgi:hypothetical protein
VEICFQLFTNGNTALSAMNSTPNAIKATNFERNPMTPIKPNLRKPSSKQQIGGLGEDLASAEFRRLGYFVFRSNYYNCPCDMAVLNPTDGKFYGVEVKARSNYDRYLRYTIDPFKFDLLAIVDPNTKAVEVRYDIEIPDPKQEVILVQSKPKPLYDPTVINIWGDKYYPPSKLQSDDWDTED